MATKTAAKSRTEIEAEISRAVIHFEKDYMGRGPLETRTYLFEDMILVRLKGVLTPAEQKLATASSPRSAYLLKQVRNELLSTSREKLEALIHNIINVRIQSIHTDISTKTGERLIVFTLADKLDFAPGDNGTPHRMPRVETVSRETKPATLTP